MKKKSSNTPSKQPVQSLISLEKLAGLISVEINNNPNLIKTDDHCDEQKNRKYCHYEANSDN
ncbi:hypothetical protein [Aliivibrio fischeri]|uniref:hypothetical protein n=1 Tax=Aliivibrio fischeri TaxID=668 RepID=UPI0007C4C03B|nr:hypothetical protein [Aliivibrio fischeri]